jgi:hypothetical protein
MTFSDSSCKRSALSYLMSRHLGTRLKFVKSAGDDNLDTNPDATSLYLQYGFVITDYQKQNPSRYDFCSTVFTPTGCYQDNVEKFVVNCIMKSPSLPMFNQLVTAFKPFEAHPEAPRYYELLKKESPA